MAAAVNPYASMPRGGERSPTVSFAITPSDSADLALGTTWIYAGGAGTIKLTCVDDPGNHSGVSITVVANQFVKVAARRVYATGTTATPLIGFSIA